MSLKELYVCSIDFISADYLQPQKTWNGMFAMFKPTFVKALMLKNIANDDSENIRFKVQTSSCCFRKYIGYIYF